MTVTTAPPTPSGPVQDTSPSLCNPLLMTDGSVIFVQCGNSSAGTGGFYWYKLTPDKDGNYIDGTWSQLPSPPVIGGTQYAPGSFASAVLPDGRVIVVGGEGNYCSSNLAGGTWCGHAETPLGAFYDPRSNRWTALTISLGSQVGDAASTVLPNGLLLLGACCDDFPQLVNTAVTPITVYDTSNRPAEYEIGEQGFTLLPNGNVLTVDLWSNTGGYTTGATAEQYNPSTGTWSSAGNIPVPLSDPVACADREIGPAVLRPDGTVVAFGGVTTVMTTLNNVVTCTPNAQDSTDIYNSSTDTWSPGPYLPNTCGASGAKYCTIADGPGVLLPNGNILIAASSAVPNDGATQFFEFTSANATSPNSIMQVAQAPGAGNPNCSASCYNFLLLPNGQILATSLGPQPLLYMPTGSPSTSWEPVIYSVPPVIYAGGASHLSGSQLNGLSQGAMYGDDVQGATNYPIVRMTASSGNVYYARSFGFSTMSVAPNTPGSTNFSVPPICRTGVTTGCFAHADLGQATLEVVANGIPSAAVNVVVKPVADVLTPIINLLLQR